MTMTCAAIELHAFSFAVGARTILKDLSLAVPKGENVSVIGPNGAGKTTLLKCLIRIHTGGSGSIRIAGRPLAGYSQRELARHLSYVPQASGHIPPFSVGEFVMLGRYPYQSAFSRASQEDRSAVDEALALTGMQALQDRPIATLSGGERQRVFIAAALAQEAEILLLDEAGVFLDPVHSAEIHGLLARINAERGTTIVSVTHDINMAALTSRRILALKDGSMAFWGTPGELMDNDRLQAIYGKSFLTVKHPRTGQDLVVPDVP